MTIITNLCLTGSSQFHNQISKEANEVTIMAGIKALDLVAGVFEEKRNAIDCVIVLDVSGSMQENASGSVSKLELCKKTIIYLIDDVLSSNDRLLLIVFSSDARVVLPLTLMTNEEKVKAKQVIQTIHAESATNLSGGLFLAIDELYSAKERNEISTILLLTDGLMNAGVSDAKTLSRMVVSKLNEEDNQMKVEEQEKERGKRVKKQNFTQPSIYAFGYGKDVDVNALTSISQECSTSAGAFYNIEDLKKVPLAFASCITGVLTIAAQTLQLTATVDSDFFLDDKMVTSIGKVVRMSSNEVVIRLQDISMGEQREILFPIRLNQNACEKPIHVEFVLKFMDTTLEKQVVLKSNFTIERINNENNLVANNDVLQHVIRVNTSISLDAARKLADAGQMKEGREKLQTQIDELNKLVEDFKITRTPIVEECFTDLKQGKDRMVDQRTYDVSGTSGFLASATHGHRVQQSVKLGMSSYSTPGKRVSMQRAETFFSGLEE